MNYTDKQLKYLKILQEQRKKNKISRYIYKKEVSFVKEITKK